MTIKTIATSRTDNIHVDENHVYVRVKDGIKNMYTDSVTKILTPGGVPDMDHIKVAAGYGTRVHAMVSSLLQNEPVIASKDELEAVSASILCRKLYKFIGEFRPANICKKSCTELESTLFCDEKFIAEYIGDGGVFGVFGGSADVVIDFKAPRGVVNVRVVVEFKTTKEKSRKHEIQTAVYMALSGAEYGLILYDNPKLSTVILEKEDIKEHLQQFEICCANYYAPILELPNDERAEHLYFLTKKISMLNAELKQLADVRKAFFNEILKEEQQIEQALHKNTDVAWGNCSIKNVSKATKSVDTSALKKKYKKIYDEVIKESRTQYFLFKLIGDNYE